MVILLTLLVLKKGRVESLVSSEGGVIEYTTFEYFAQIYEIYVFQLINSLCY